MDKVFADTDICLDLLSERQPHYKAAARLFTAADEGRIKLYVSAVSFPVLDYLLKQQLGAVRSRHLLSAFKTIVNVMAVDGKIIALALASEFSDFEDAVQYYTAAENGIKVIITRNLKDYKKALLPVMTAEAYLGKSK